MGIEEAERITNRCAPMLAKEAMQIGYLDHLFAEDWDEFHTALRHYAFACGLELNAAEIIEAKNLQRSKDEAIKPLAQYRQEELAKMKEIFNDPQCHYHLARYNFVHKILPSEACWVKNSSAGLIQLAIV